MSPRRITKNHKESRQHLLSWTEISSNHSSKVSTNSLGVPAELIKPIKVPKIKQNNEERKNKTQLIFFIFIKFISLLESSLT